MNKKKASSEKSEMQKIKSRQLRLFIFAFTVLAILGLILWLVLSLVGSLGEEKEPEIKKYNFESIEAYIAENWSEFEFDSFDSASGTLRLKGKTDYTYEQAEKYGEVVFDNEYLDAYVNLVQQIAIGLSVDCDINGCTICLEQYSSDEEVIYTVDSSGQTTACWDEAPTQ